MSDDVTVPWICEDDFEMRSMATGFALGKLDERMNSHQTIYRAVLPKEAIMQADLLAMSHKLMLADVVPFPPIPELALCTFCCPECVEL